MSGTYAVSVQGREIRHAIVFAVDLRRSGIDVLAFSVP